MNGIKLNLYLRVLGRRADGYHQLEHICVPFKGPDSVRVERAMSDSLEVSGLFADGLVGENLCTKALHMYRRLTGSTQAYRVTLVKNTPVGSGLGAGSYNAANLIKQISVLENNSEVLKQNFLALGAELPFCMADIPALVKGVGEDIKPLENRAELYPVLVWPGQGVNTADVFRVYAENSHLSKSTQNELTAAAIFLCPAIADALALLQDTGKPIQVTMTGSGSTCFALYETPDDAQVAEQELRTKVPSDWWVYRP